MIDYFKPIIIQNPAGFKLTLVIANALVISHSTAKAHVSNILGKLQLSDRTQAAAYAWETGLMQRSP